MSDPVTPPVAPATPAPAAPAAAPAAPATPPAAAPALTVAELTAQLNEAKAELARSTAATQAANKEAADRRVALKTEKDKADAEALKVANEKGEWGTVLKLEREKTDALAKDLESAKAKAAKADEYEGDLKARRDAALAQMPEAERADYLALPLGIGLRLAEKHLASKVTPAARQTAAGNPPGTVVAIDFHSLSAPDKAKAVEGKSTAELLALMGKQPKAGFRGK